MSVAHQGVLDRKSSALPTQEGLFSRKRREKKLPPFWGIPFHREGAYLRWPYWGLSRILAGSSKGTPTPFQAFQRWFHVGEFSAAVFFVEKKC